MSDINGIVNNMTTTEKKYINSPHEDWWICECGNQPNYDGFFSCKSDGTIVSPVIDGEWNDNTFICLRCGIIINNYNLEIVGTASKEIQEINNNYDWSNY